jgi:hypothetical protein
MPNPASIVLNPKTLALLGLGTAGGGLFGRYVTPKIFGYKGDPAATNLSTLVDAAAGLGLAALAANPAAAAKLLARPMAIPTAVGGLALSETLPMAAHAVGRGTSAAETLSRTRAIDQLREVAGSPIGRGVGIGAAGAGLAGVTSGLLRPKTTSERSLNKSRGSMVASDFLKFLIPAMIAGGLGGHVMGSQ